MTEPSLIAHPLCLNNKHPKNKYFENYQLDTPSEIIPDLWLGNYTHAYAGCSLRYNFSYIFNIGVKVKSALPISRSTTVEVDDVPSARIIDLFADITKEIHQRLSQGHKVYVHCFVGMSRSPTIIIAYLIKYENMSLLKAYELVKTRRPIIKINHGFRYQLMEWERQCIATENNRYRWCSFC